MNDQPIKNIEEQIRREHTLEVSKKGEEHYDALVGAVRKNLNKLPEAVFVEHFLPYFSGVKDLKSKEGEQIIPNWIGIAGSPTSEVQIFNQETNELLYIVPALVDSTSFDALNKSNASTFKSIVNEYELHKNITPAVGQNFVTKALSKRADQLTGTPENFSENNKRWLDIFARYSGAAAKQVTSNDSGNLTEDDFIYD